MKIAFIIPYFGKFKNYFQLFLNSCKYNPNVDWLIFTDDHSNFDYPNNVVVYYTTFEEMKVKFRGEFDFPISLDRPYKLCDYRPSYGYVFEDYLTSYDAWGYCDTDLIWGDFSKFIGPELLNEYDKIGDMGHCTIFRNEYNNNRAFMFPQDGRLLYKEVFSSSYNNSFDEEYKNSINTIFMSKGLKIYPSSLFMANIYTKSSDFRLTMLNQDKKYQIERKSKNIFVWDKGNLSRYIKKNGNIEHHEYLYLHMQSRQMSLKLTDVERFKIIPNSFDDFKDRSLTAENFPKYKHFNMHYFRLRTSNLLDKIRKKLIRGR
ncbi:hypothetical protein C5Z25_02730 [Lactobacillus sp. CBA3605]|uniref:DUF6625 family protein n=1 Tax=Lactobacillus sp. CBA3605 TaxID=2099788 RepID=UPI000CFD1EF4|nr:DUF6625 family protein [Lactobacillus sp. CBA3605]AVK60726.1 hypothetical protein C5Z25_02730 [Lactobacillus sp. CBA3605]